MKQAMGSSRLNAVLGAWLILCAVDELRAPAVKVRGHLNPFEVLRTRRSSSVITPAR
jgi:hypothetical protein